MTSKVRLSSTITPPGSNRPSSRAAAFTAVRRSATTEAGSEAVDEPGSDTRALPVSFDYSDRENVCLGISNEDAVVADTVAVIFVVSPVWSMTRTR